MALDPTRKRSSLTLSNGNLTETTSASTSGIVEGVQGRSAGQRYFEVTINVAANGADVGIGDASLNMETQVVGSDVHSYGYTKAGQKGHNGSYPAYGATFTSGDILSVLYDADAGSLSFWKNGVDQGVAFTGLTGTWYPLLGGAGNGSVGSQETVNFGATAFTYSPPVGYNSWEDTPASHGNAAPSLKAITGSGSRIAAGAASLQALTGVGGYHGIGAASFELMVASGSGGPHFGAGILAPLTALATGHSSAYSGSVLSALTGVGTGHSSAIIGLAEALPMFTIEASGLTGQVGTLAEILPAITLLSEVGGAADLTLPTITLSATLATGSIGDLAGTLPALTCEAIALPSILATGSSVLPALTLVATMVHSSIANAALTLPRIYSTAHGFAGEVGTFVGSLPLITLAGVGYGPLTSDLSETLPQWQLQAEIVFSIPALYRTWAFNVRKKGLTEYLGFSFNSYTIFQDQVLTAGTAGVHLHAGSEDTDVGAQIAARIRTGHEAFGTSFNKRVPRVYIGAATMGPMHLSTLTSQGGTRVYLLPYNGLTAIQQRRVPIGRGPKSPYWQFELANKDGADFTLENMQVYPERSSRRVI